MNYRRIMFGALLAVVANSAQAAETRNFIILSDDYGGINFIGFPHNGEVGTDLRRTSEKSPTTLRQAATLNEQEIGDRFKAMCLAKPFDRAAYDAAMDGVAKDFATDAVRLESSTWANPLLGSTTREAATFNQESAPYGYASLWLGENAENLAGRQYNQFSGSLKIVGPVSLKRFYAPQCNLSVHVAGWRSATLLLDAIGSMSSGTVQVKRYEKPKYAGGVWTQPGEGGRLIRMTVSIDGLDKPSQLVEMSVQMLPVGKKK
jgi:hypothetical protein